MKTPVLFTGCPRSGTHFIAEVMTKACNLFIGHEFVWGDGTADWRGVAPVYNKEDFRLVFHQVREPLVTIQSLHTITPISKQYMQRTVIKDLFVGSELLQAMKVWYYWVSKAESLSPLTYRVENIDKSIDVICSIIGTTCNRDILDEIPKNANSRVNVLSYPTLTWQKLEDEDIFLCNRIRKLSSELGYR